MANEVMHQLKKLIITFKYVFIKFILIVFKHRSTNDIEAIECRFHLKPVGLSEFCILNMH